MLRLSTIRAEIRLYGCSPFFPIWQLSNFGINEIGWSKKRYICYKQAYLFTHNALHSLVARLLPLEKMAGILQSGAAKFKCI